MDKRLTRINLKHLIFGAVPSYDETSKLTGMELNFFAKNADEVYTKSYLKKFEVASGFNFIKLKLDAKQLIRLTATLIEGVSTYLYNVRYQIAGEEHMETYIRLTEDKRGKNNYELRVTNNRKKVRKHDKDDTENALTRYKVMIAVSVLVDGSDKAELVELRFTKRDVTMMLTLLRNILSGSLRVFNFAHVNAISIDEESTVLSDPSAVSISKIDNSIAFGDVFLHGQEILNLNYAIEELVHGFEIENRLRSIFTTFRQIEIFPYNDFMIGLRVKKMMVTKNEMTSEFSHEFDENHQDKEFVFNNRLLAGLYLFLTPSQLRHSTVLENSAQTSKTDFGRKVLYHVNLRESNLAVGFNAKPKLKKVKSGDSEYMSFFYLSAVSKNGMFEAGKAGYMKHFLPGTTEPTYVPSIDRISLSLHGKWIHFLETMTRSNNNEFDEDATIIRKRLHIFADEAGLGKVKFTIGLYSDSENQAPLVLSIEKFKKDDEKVIGKFRQPMFKKYIKEFLTISMQSAYELNNFLFSEEKDMKDIIGVKYKDLKKPVEAIPSGIIVKIGIEKKANRVVRIGDLNKKEQSTILDYNDVMALNSSCAHRILHGQWLPFIGERISISQDGFLTDLFSEVALEDKGMGAFHAWQYFFGTAIR